MTQFYSMHKCLHLKQTNYYYFGRWLTLHHHQQAKMLELNSDKFVFLLIISIRALVFFTWSVLYVCLVGYSFVFILFITLDCRWQVTFWCVPLCASWCFIIVLEPNESNIFSTSCTAENERFKCLWTPLWWLRYQQQALQIAMMCLWYRIWIVWNEREREKREEKNSQISEKFRFVNCK